MKINKIKINTKSKSYWILIGNNLLNNNSKNIQSNKINFKKCLVIKDKNVPKKFILKIKSKLKKKIIVKTFKLNEKNKNFKNVTEILNLLFKNKFNRNDCLIALGGGITGDVAGFAASIYKRGLKFINIPTTLLSQVDSSIGGKTGINNNFGKNLVGSFFQPDLVISDVLLLKSLPKREILCGYGEILKHSLISNKKNFNYLKKNYKKIISLKTPFIEKAIIDSCKVKKNIVEKDEREKSSRKKLNFGHTFAHAYEATLNYSNKLNHGEAVIMGIKSAIQFSYKNKLISKKDTDEIIEHISLLNSNDSLKKFFKKKDIKKILKFMKSDKKNTSSKINLILLKKINKPILNLNFSNKQVIEYLKSELMN